MDPKNTNITKVLEKRNPIDFVYLGTILLLLIITLITFFYSTNFIIQNVNKIFYPGEGGNSQALDMTRYSLVEKKLNLPVNTVSTDTTINTQAEKQVTPNNPATTPMLDKKSITLNILNSTKKVGVASVLAKALESAGFSKATTGNETKVYTQTTILIKDSKKDFTPLVEDVVKKSYPNAITATNPESSKFDVVIIISNNT